MLREGKKQSTKRVSYIYEVHTIWEQKWYQISTEKSNTIQKHSKRHSVRKEIQFIWHPNEPKNPHSFYAPLRAMDPSHRFYMLTYVQRQGCSAFNFKESNVQILGLLTAYYVETLHDPNQPCLTSKHLLLSRTKMMVILNEDKMKPTLGNLVLQMINLKWNILLNVLVFFLWGGGGGDRSLQWNFDVLSPIVFLGAKEWSRCSFLLAARHVIDLLTNIPLLKSDKFCRSFTSLCTFHFQNLILKITIHPSKVFIGPYVRDHTIFKNFYHFAYQKFN